MGEKQDDAAKKDDIVFKIDMHCDGCAKKLKKFLKRFPGVEGIKTDCDSNKLSVTGKVDPAKLRYTLAEKTKKKVELLTPLPMKGDVPVKKSDDKAAEKPNLVAAYKSIEAPAKEEQKPKEPAIVTVVFKTRLHCDGCIQKIYKIVKKYKGVQDASLDGTKDLVTIKGLVDVKAMQAYLKEKLRRDVEVIPAKKEEKKEENKVVNEEKKKGQKKGDEKKGEQIGEGKKALVVEAPKMEINKMQHYGNSEGPSTSHVYGDGHMYDYSYPISSQEYYGHPSLPSTIQDHNMGYAMEQYQMQPYAYNYNDQTPQMFSDENPNGCSVM